MDVGRLNERWQARRTSGQIDLNMRFSDEGLVLGAGTVLAPVGSSGRDTKINPAEPRLRTLLAAAHRRMPTVSGLTHLRKAAERWSSGEDAIAAMHLALSCLDRLGQPDSDAQRLFLADALLREGLEADLLIKALDLDEVVGLAKYSPDQPRVPAGSGRSSGEWTADGGGVASAPLTALRLPKRPSQSTVAPTQPRVSAKPAMRATSASTRTPQASLSPGANGRSARIVGSGGSPVFAGSTIAIDAAGAGLDLGAMTARGLTALAAWAAGLSEISVAAAGAGFAAFAGVLFIPSTGPHGKWVKVSGPANISYFLSPTERGVGFRYTTADGVQREWETIPGADGKLRGPDGRVIGRLVKTGAKLGLVVSTAALVGPMADEPRVCPAPSKDNGGPLGRAYENFVKAQFNPGNPTPPGLAYAFFDPLKGRSWKIDDCKWRPGLVAGHPFEAGALAEYKGPGYAEHLLKKDFLWRLSMSAELDTQALRQVRAKGGRSLTWFVEEKPLADYLGEQFRLQALPISVLWLPRRTSTR
jgi:hypothetical protein